MITTKEYDNAVGEASKTLQIIYEESVLFAEDYMITTDKVKRVCLTLLEITLKFKGQEEGK